MSSDDSDGPTVRKRPRRAARKRRIEQFSSGEENDTTDTEGQVPEPRHSSRRESFENDAPNASQVVKHGTPGIRVHKSFRALERSASMISSAVDTIDDNDDEEERRARRRSRLLELHQRSMNSPGAKTAERIAKATPLSNMSEAAIAEHYGNCIKLAAENKINAKNAFNLHLIDYMKDILHSRQLENFQVASSSLDAGAKIYAGRVDAVHQDTFKVLGGLGRSKSENAGADEEGAENNDEGDEQQRQTRKPSQPRRKKGVIQKNFSKIRIKSVDFKTDVDPLFQHQAIAYDEGGTNELRLNHVFSKDNSCELILDSDAQIMGTSRLRRDEDGDICLDREGWRSIQSAISESAAPMEVCEPGLEVCPSFADFSFTDWNDDEPVTDPTELSHDEHAFDPNAEVEPMPPPGDISDVDVVSLDDNSVASGDVPHAETSVYIGESKEAMLVQSAVDGMIHSSTTFVDSLRLMLTEQLNNRGQLHDNLLGMWAGPDHWKTKAKNLFPSRPAVPSRHLSCSPTENATDAGTNGDTQGTEESRRNKNRFGREKGYIALDDILLGEDTVKKMEDEIKKVFRRGRAAISLSDQSVDRSMKRNFLLPPVIEYDKQSIIQLMNKKVIVVTRTESTDEGGEVSDYNFNNARDAANFCPPVEGSPEPDGDAFNGPCGDDDAADLPPCGEDYGGGDDDMEPFAGAFTQGVPDTQGEQLELISQPRKIAKIEIGYAKTAKRINVRQIKLIMWNFLTMEERNGNLQSPPTQDQETPEVGNSKEICTAKHFSEMTSFVPQKVNKQTAEDLSVPVLFNCLLHLANEKCLQIENSSDLDELFISQASAPPRQKELAAKLLKRNVAQARLDNWMETDDTDES